MIKINIGNPEHSVWDVPNNSDFYIATGFIQVIDLNNNLGVLFIEYHYPVLFKLDESDDETLFVKFRKVDSRISLEKNQDFEIKEFYFRPASHIYHFDLTREDISSFEVKIEQTCYLIDESSEGEIDDHVAQSYGAIPDGELAITYEDKNLTEFYAGKSLKELNALLDESVRDEDYEKSAVIRDVIAKK